MREAFFHLQHFFKKHNLPMEGLEVTITCRDQGVAGAVKACLRSELHPAEYPYGSQQDVDQLFGVPFQIEGRQRYLSHSDDYNRGARYGISPGMSGMPEYSRDLLDAQERIRKAMFIDLLAQVKLEDTPMSVGRFAPLPQAEPEKPAKPVNAAVATLEAKLASVKAIREAAEVNLNSTLSMMGSYKNQAAVQRGQLAEKLKAERELEAALKKIQK